jgi:hypothetical protein
MDKNRLIIGCIQKSLSQKHKPVIAYRAAANVDGIAGAGGKAG